ncbi:MAG TPA: hypothetical protein VHW23_34390 [Kofleriaceae bacterium]|nr:hypothetical protein [Kofleriaceae bacterium]
MRIASVMWAAVSRRRCGAPQIGRNAPASPRASSADQARASSAWQHGATAISSAPSAIRAVKRCAGDADALAAYEALRTATGGAGIALAARLAASG